MSDPKYTAAETHRLQSAVDVLREQVAVLTRTVAKQQRVLAASENLTRVFAEYHDSNGRKVPALITAVWPRAGTVDIFIFDSTYSGGTHEITGVYIGAARGEVMPYLSADEDEEAVKDGELVAS
jgi:hypothetical protein